MGQGTAAGLLGEAHSVRPTWVLLGPWDHPDPSFPWEAPVARKEERANPREGGKEARRSQVD